MQKTKMVPLHDKTSREKPQLNKKLLLWSLVLKGARTRIKAITPGISYSSIILQFVNVH